MLPLSYNAAALCVSTAFVAETAPFLANLQALLGYYICDDCCKSDTGTAFQAQAYNFIKAADPYHIVIGASDCADNYM